MTKRLVTVLVAMLMMVCMVCGAMNVSAANTGFIAKSSKTAMTRLAKGAQDLTPHKSFKVYNFQGTGKTWTYTMSSRDVKILKNFENKHFTKSMTPAQKVAYTMEWIHSNVTYASSASNWSKIANKSWVDAIFNNRLGQCVQYNGALMCMMAYLGYDVSMVQGYRTSYYSRGNRWQHFWGQVKIGNTTYLVEAGNKGKSGNWYHLCADYDETRGYVY